MISEHVAAQAHFEESKGNRHNTSTGLALPTTSHFDVFISRMEQRDERHIHGHPYAASEVHRETELGTKDTEEAPSSAGSFRVPLFFVPDGVARIELRLWLGPLEVHAARPQDF